MIAEPEVFLIGIEDPKANIVLNASTKDRSDVRDTRSDFYQSIVSKADRKRFFDLEKKK